MEKRTYEIVLSSSIIFFCDAISISSKDEIFIADASSFSPTSPENILPTSYIAVGSGIAEGRLLKYTPSNGALETLIGNLTFANGVVLAHDESFVLVSDGSAFRTRRYWLKGPLAGSVDSFIPSLPGGGDGLGRGSNGTYWVVIYFRVNKFREPVFRYRLLRWAILYVPAAMREKFIVRHSIVIQVRGDGLRMAETLCDVGRWKRAVFEKFPRSWSSLRPHDFCPREGRSTLCRRLSSFRPARGSEERCHPLICFTICPLAFLALLSLSILFPLFEHKPLTYQATVVRL